MISGISRVNVHAEDTLRITPITLGDLNGIRRSLNSALAFLDRPPLVIAQTDMLTNYADATDLLDTIEKIPGMEYTASTARDRLLRLYILSASLDARHPSVLASVPA